MGPVGLGRGWGWDPEAKDLGGQARWGTCVHKQTFRKAEHGGSWADASPCPGLCLERRGCWLWA